MSPDDIAGMGGISDPENESEQDRARRFDHFEIAPRPDRSWWQVERDSLGVIYRATDLDTLAPVSLRIIDANAAAVGPPDAIFQAAMRVARFQHPNVARLIHFGSTANGQCVLVSEWIDGESLSARVRRTGPLPVPLVLDIAAQVSQALVAADEHRLRHENLCPANIMLCDIVGAVRPRVIVRDFGVAGWFAQVDHEFASPESLAGERTDLRSDFFSLGALLYFLLSGQAPRVDSAVGRVHFTPLRRLGIPNELLVQLSRLLAVSPATRPKDAFALVDAVESIRRPPKPAGENMPTATLTPRLNRWRNWFGGKDG